MYIKTNYDSSKNIFSRFKNVLINLKKKYKIIAIIFVGVIVAAMFFYLGAVAQSQQFIAEVVRPAIKTNYKTPINFIRGILSTVDRISIDIKFDDYKKLSQKRREALDAGILISSDDDYVPASIHYNDKNVKVKLRLKGDLIDHLRGDKWSFRIEVKGDDTLFGMQSFAIQAPPTRNYVYEWIFHELLRREGLVALKYNFIDVVLNGEHLGIYALEEHFDKILVERSGNLKGPIIKLNEDLFWKDSLNTALDNNSTTIWRNNANTTGLREEFASNVDVFQASKILEDPNLLKQYELAVSLLESFRRGNLRTGQVFDLTKLARFYAISDLTGTTSHGGSTNWQNLRLYYNPITSLFEPIGFDGHSGSALQYIVGISGQEKRLRLEGDYIVEQNFLSLIFSDPEFYAEYVSEIERIGTKEYLDKFFDEIDSDLESKLSAIYRSYPQFYFTKDNFYVNQNNIQAILHPVRGVHVYLESEEVEQISLGFSNTQLLPLEIVSVNNGGNIFEPKSKIILQPRRRGVLGDYQIFDFVLSNESRQADEIISEFIVNYRILGSGSLYNEKASLLPHGNENFLENDFLRGASNIDKFQFLIVNHKNNEIVMKKGNWLISENILIPKGFKFFITEGTRLNLVQNAKIVSLSPVYFNGSADNPIYIESSNGSGQGVAILSAGDESIINYVVFDNLSFPNQNDWFLSGAVTFYESPVLIKNSQFLNNRSEDGLNIKRSEFMIENVVFKKNASDAFDSDFSDGEIRGTSIVESGNDGLDFSGSVIFIEGVSIDGAGDKGISVGEESRVKIEAAEISNCNIGLASKDNSSVVMSDIKIIKCKYVLAAYQKKSEFGPASIEANNLDTDDMTSIYLEEEGSKIIIDSERVSGALAQFDELIN